MKTITAREWFEARGLKPQPAAGFPGFEMIVDPEAPKNTVYVMNIDTVYIRVPNDWPNQKARVK